MVVHYYRNGGFINAIALLYKISTSSCWRYKIYIIQNFHLLASKVRLNTELHAAIIYNAFNFVKMRIDKFPVRYK
jgi:hypothetical protein